jgi:hypothetical protein
MTSQRRLSSTAGLLALVLLSSPALLAAQTADKSTVRPAATRLGYERSCGDPVGSRSEVSSTGDPTGRPVWIRELIRDIPGDFRSFPSWDTGLWLTLGAVGGLAIHPADARISDSLSGNEGLGDVVSAGDVIGGVWVQGGAAALAYGIGLATGKPKLSRIGAELIRSQILSQAVALGFKVAVRRTRPDGGRYSFPSGHATAVFASAVVLQHELGWNAGIPAYLVASYVCIARVQGRHHYPSDVVFGAMVGVAGARTVTLRSDVVSGAMVGAASTGIVTLRAGRTRLQMTAAAIPRGIYVGFVVAPHR